MILGKEELEEGRNMELLLRLQAAGFQAHCDLGMLGGIISTLVGAAAALPTIGSGCVQLESVPLS